MFVVWGDWWTGGQQAFAKYTSRDPVIIGNNSVTRRIHIPDHGLDYSNSFYNETELKERYWASSYILPVGSLLILTALMVLMLSFKRLLVAGLLVGVLGTIFVFAVLVSINHSPIYS